MKHSQSDIPDWDGSEARRRRWLAGIILAVLTALSFMCSTLHDFDRRMNDGSGTPDWQQQEVNDRADEAQGANQ